MRPTFCEDAAPSFFNLLDVTIAPPLLWYAYVPIVLLALVLSAIALYYNRGNRNALLLTGMALSLAFYVVITFLQWIAAPITLVMFSWELWNLAHAALYLFTVLFIYSFVFDTAPPHWLRIVLLIPLIPIILFTPTQLNIEWFDLSWCEGVMHPFLLIYTYCFDVLAMGIITWIGFAAYRDNARTKLTPGQVLIVTGGALAFLFLFFATTVWGDVIGDYRVEIIGPVGALLFLAGVSYVSVNYNRFDIRLLATELLIIGLVTVVGSILFVQTLDHIRYVAGGSMVLVVVLGWLLARSVRREIEQRKRIEHLAEKLETANKRLKVLDQLKSEFVSIASHQLRSPLTSIRGYASMLLEGSFGKLSQKGKEAVERIAESSRYMALSVEDYLNVSRIESGRMKYEVSDFNLTEMVEKIVDDVRPAVVKRGLMITFKSSTMSSRGMVHGDIGKTQQIIHNLLDNAMKYTEKGSIKVVMRENKRAKRVYVDVTDTGVGMDQETIDEVFEKFVRARNANQVNVTGTGLGLYVAKQMAAGMGGDITARSPGEGTGSTFTLELPLSK